MGHFRPEKCGISHFYVLKSVGSRIFKDVKAYKEYRRAGKTCSPEEEFRKVMINGKSGTEIMLYNFYTAYIQRLKLFL